MTSEIRHILANSDRSRLDRFRYNFNLVIDFVQVRDVKESGVFRPWHRCVSDHLEAAHRFLQSLYQAADLGPEIHPGLPGRRPENVDSLQPTRGQAGRRDSLGASTPGPRRSSGEF